MAAPAAGRVQAVLMSRITWQHVRPLLDSWYLSSHDLHCRFRCPVTGRVFEASAPRDAASTQSTRPSPLRAKSLRRDFRHGLARGVLDLELAAGARLPHPGSSPPAGAVATVPTGALALAAATPLIPPEALGLLSIEPVRVGAAGSGPPGSGPAGSVARKAVRVGSAPVAAGPAPPDPDDPPRAPVLQAFRSVVSRLSWHAPTARWRCAAPDLFPLSPYLEQRLNHPMIAREDLTLLARMVTEVTVADGALAPAERAALAALAGPESSGTVAKYLATASPGPVRETMLMIAWGVALCDEGLDPAVRISLESFASGLGVAPEIAAELEHRAAQYVLETALRLLEALLDDDRQVREEAADFARRLGLSAAEVESALAHHVVLPDHAPVREMGPCRRD